MIKLTLCLTVALCVRSSAAGTVVDDCKELNKMFEGIARKNPEIVPPCLLEVKDYTERISIMIADIIRRSNTFDQAMTSLLETGGNMMPDVTAHNEKNKDCGLNALMAYQRNPVFFNNMASYLWTSPEMKKCTASLFIWFKETLNNFL